MPNEHRKILLTGGTGHTGRRLARRLLDSGVRLRCLSHNPERRNRLPEAPNCEIVEGSAASVEDLRRVAEGMDCIIHMAHLRYAENWIAALRNRTRPVRILFTSSTWFHSAFASERRNAVRRNEAAIVSAPDILQWTILRPSAIYGGPDDNNIERLVTFVRRHNVFPVFGDGTCLRQPVFVLDLVEAFVNALDCEAAVNQAYDLAGAEPVAYRDMVLTIARLLGKKPPRFVHLPRRLCAGLARAGQMVYPRFPVSPQFILRFGEDHVFDNAPAQHDLGFKPRTFEAGLRIKLDQQV